MVVEELNLNDPGDGTNGGGDNGGNGKAQGEAGVTTVPVLSDFSEQVVDSYDGPSFTASGSKGSPRRISSFLSGTALLDNLENPTITLSRGFGLRPNLAEDIHRQSSIGLIDPYIGSEDIESFNAVAENSISGMQMNVGDRENFTVADVGNSSLSELKTLSEETGVPLADFVRTATLQGSLAYWTDRDVSLNAGDGEKIYDNPIYVPYVDPKSQAISVHSFANLMLDNIETEYEWEMVVASESARIEMNQEMVLQMLSQPGGVERHYNILFNSQGKQNTDKAKELQEQYNSMGAREQAEFRQDIMSEYINDNGVYMLSPSILYDRYTSAYQQQADDWIAGKYGSEMMYETVMVDGQPYQKNIGTVQTPPTDAEIQQYRDKVSKIDSRAFDKLISVYGPEYAFQDEAYNHALNFLKGLDNILEEARPANGGGLTRETQEYLIKNYMYSYQGDLSTSIQAAERGRSLSATWPSNEARAEFRERTGLQDVSGIINANTEAFFSNNDFAGVPPEERADLVEDLAEEMVSKSGGWGFGAKSEDPTEFIDPDYYPFGVAPKTYEEAVTEIYNNPDLNSLITAERDLIALEAEYLTNNMTHHMGAAYAALLMPDMLGQQSEGQAKGTINDLLREQHESNPNLKNVEFRPLPPEIGSKVITSRQLALYDYHMSFYQAYQERIGVLDDNGFSKRILELKDVLNRKQREADEWARENPGKAAFISYADQSRQLITSHPFSMFLLSDNISGGVNDVMYAVTGDEFFNEAAERNYESAQNLVRKQTLTNTPHFSNNALNRKVAEYNGVYLGLNADGTPNGRVFDNNGLQVEAVETLQDFYSLSDEDQKAVTAKAHTHYNPVMGYGSQAFGIGMQLLSMYSFGLSATGGGLQRGALRSGINPQTSTYGLGGFGVGANKFNLGMSWNIWSRSYAESYKQMLNGGVPAREAALLSTGTATLTLGSARILGAERFFFNKAAMPPLNKTLIELAKVSGKNPSTFFREYARGSGKYFKKLGFGFGKGYTGENVQEIFDQFQKNAAVYTFGDPSVHNMTSVITGQQMKDISLLTLPFGGASGAFNASTEFNIAKSKYEFARYNFWRLSRRQPENIASILNEGIESGTITRADAHSALQRIKTYQDAAADIDAPVNLTEDAEFALTQAKILVQEIETKLNKETNPERRAELQNELDKASEDYTKFYNDLIENHTIIRFEFKEMPAHLMDRDAKIVENEKGEQVYEIYTTKATVLEGYDGSMPHIIVAPNGGVSVSNHSGAQVSYVNGEIIITPTTNMKGAMMTVKNGNGDVVEYTEMGDKEISIGIPVKGAYYIEIEGFESAIEQAEGVVSETQEGTSEELQTAISNKAAEVAIQTAKKAGIDIEAQNQADFDKTLDDAQKRGVQFGFDPKTAKVVTIPNKDGSYTTYVNTDRDLSARDIFQDVWHQIALNPTEESKINEVEMLGILANDPNIESILPDLKTIVNTYDKEDIPSEVLARLFADLATGYVDLNENSQTAVQRFIGFFNGLVTPKSNVKVDTDGTRIMDYVPPTVSYGSSEEVIGILNDAAARIRLGYRPEVSDLPMTPKTPGEARAFASAEGKTPMQQLIDKVEAGEIEISAPDLVLLTNEDLPQSVLESRDSSIASILADPSKASSIINTYRSITEEAQGATARAEQTEEAAAERDVQNAASFAGQAQVQYDLGNTDKAADLAEEAVFLDPNNQTGLFILELTNPVKAAFHYNRRAINKEEDGDKAGALRDYNTAIELDDQNNILSNVYYANRATLHDESGQLNDALADYNKAIELNPNNPDYYYNRADVHEKLGDLDAARLDREAGDRLSKGIDSDTESTETQVDEPTTPARGKSDIPTAKVTLDKNELIADIISGQAQLNSPAYLESIGNKYNRQLVIDFNNQVDLSPETLSELDVKELAEINEAITQAITYSIPDQEFSYLFGPLFNVKQSRVSKQNGQRVATVINNSPSMDLLMIRTRLSAWLSKNNPMSRGKKKRKGVIELMMDRTYSSLIDLAVGNYNAQDLKESLVDEFTQGAGVFLDQYSQFSREVHAALKPFRGLRETNAKVRSRYEIQLALLHFEYLLNVDNPTTHHAADYIDVLIDPKNRPQGYTESDIEILKDLFTKYDKLPRFNEGQKFTKNQALEIIKANLSDAEFEAFIKLRDAYDKLAEIEEYINGTILGRDVVNLDGYTHHSTTESNQQLDVQQFKEDVSSVELANQRASDPSPVLPRTDVVPQLNLDAGYVSQRAANSLFGYMNIAPAIELLDMTLQEASDKVNDDRAEVYDNVRSYMVNYVDVVNNNVAGVNKEVVGIVSPGDIDLQTIWETAKTMAYRSTLARAYRAADLGSNIIYSLLDPGTVTKGTTALMKMWGDDNVNLENILTNVRSTMKFRIMPSATGLGARGEVGKPTQVMSEKKQAESAISNWIATTANIGKLPFTALGAAMDFTITSPDLPMARPYWTGKFIIEFNRLTKQDPDFEKISNNDAQYMNQYGAEITAATKYADMALSSLSPPAGSLADIRMRVIQNSRGEYRSGFAKEVLYPMATFHLRDVDSWRVGITSAFRNGTITRKEAIRLLAQIYARQTVYFTLKPYIQGGLLSIFSDDEYEDPKKEEFFPKSPLDALRVGGSRALFSLLGQYDGTSLTNVFLSSGANYLQELITGEETAYNEQLGYGNALTSEFIRDGFQFTNDFSIEDFGHAVIALGGPTVNFYAKPVFELVIKEQELEEFYDRLGGDPVTTPAQKRREAQLIAERDALYNKLFYLPTYDGKESFIDNAMDNLSKYEGGLLFYQFPFSEDTRMIKREDRVDFYFDGMLVEELAKTHAINQYENEYNMQMIEQEVITYDDDGQRDPMTIKGYPDKAYIDRETGLESGISWNRLITKITTDKQGEVNAEVSNIMASDPSLSESEALQKAYEEFGITGMQSELQRIDQTGTEGALYKDLMSYIGDYSYPHFPAKKTVGLESIYGGDYAKADAYWTYEELNELKYEEWVFALTRKDSDGMYTVGDVKKMYETLTAVDAQIMEADIQTNMSPETRDQILEMHKKNFTAGLGLPEELKEMDDADKISLKELSELSPYGQLISQTTVNKKLVDDDMVEFLYDEEIGHSNFEKSSSGGIRLSEFKNLPYPKTSYINKYDVYLRADD